MEWSKDKTMKLIELLQVNTNLWNPSLCDTRRDKQKRKEELRAISEHLGINVPDITKKIQHLRTQYNRESAREVRANAENPNDRYVSNWYAFDYLHFMKDSTKPYRVLELLISISPKLFSAVLETIFRNLQWERNGLSINGEKLNHLRFADDIILFSENPDNLKDMLQQLSDESAKVGLSMNTSKTKEEPGLNGTLPNQSNSSISDCKLMNLSPIPKSARTESQHTVKSETNYPANHQRNRDEFSVFGEYIANELRSLKGEKNLLVAKKKIQDAIFEVKMSLICETKSETSECTVYSHTHNSAIQSKMYSTPVMSSTAHIEPLPTSHAASSGAAINEIIINGACHYTNFKVDSQ